MSKKKDAMRMQRIAEKLKDLRISGGYSSYENFAFDNDLPRMSYWRLENGVTNFSFKTLTRILDIHSVSLSEFFNDID